LITKKKKKKTSLEKLFVDWVPKTSVAFTSPSPFDWCENISLKDQNQAINEFVTGVETKVNLFSLSLFLS